MQSIPLRCLAVFIVLISGCASISTSSDYVRGTDFSHLKTYAWVPGPQPAAGDPRIDNTLTDTRIRNAVEHNLAAKGFLKASVGEPDFLVAYRAAIAGKIDVTTVDSPYAVPSSADILRGNFDSSVWAYGGTQTFVNQYEEGSVYIDVIDPKSHKLIWRGTGKATVLDKATPEKRETRINEGVKKILSEFPPA